MLLVSLLWPGRQEQLIKERQTRKEEPRSLNKKTGGIRWPWTGYGSTQAPVAHGRLVWRKGTRTSNFHFDLQSPLNEGKKSFPQKSLCVLQLTPAYLNAQNEDKWEAFQRLQQTQKVLLIYLNSQTIYPLSSACPLLNKTNPSPECCSSYRSYHSSYWSTLFSLLATHKTFEWLPFQISALLNEWQCKLPM